MTTDSPPQDTGRRRRRAAERGGGAGAAQPAGQPQSPFAPLDLISSDELESIHRAALSVLKEIGVDFLHDEARAILKSAGAEVDPGSRRVRFDPDLVESRIGLAPQEFKLHARNSGRNLSIGGRHVAFGTVGSAPNSFDRAGGRRPGNKRDYQNFIRLGQSFDSIHFIGGYPVEPIDIHASIRHLDALFDMLTLSDKPVHAYSLGRERNLDAIEMVKIARGVDDETLEREPSLFTVINSSSPLRLDTPMLEGIIQMARRNQVVVMTPFTLAGAMAPVTLAGALAQQHAEALAGLVMTQAARPGAPFVYGGFTSNVDMKSGAPAFGTPEYMKTAIVGGQLARRLGLPYRSSNANAANSLDAQAAYESVFSLWGAIMGGVNFLMHGAGWMEGGLQASFEKMALDADLLAMVAEFLRPLRVDEAELALEAMREVGPGGHFFGAKHTQSRYRTAFFPPTISDWRNYETWREAGSPTAVDAAERVVADRLRDFVAPPLEAERLEALTAFVARRKAEGGAPTDFLNAVPPLGDPRLGASLHAAVAAVFFALGVGVGLWGGASGAILVRSGVDASTFGVLLTVYTGAYLIAMSAGGALAHRFGVEQALPVSAIIYGAALYALLNASSEAWVAIALIVAGFLGGVVDVLMNAEGARIERRLGRPILARLHAAASAGMALGAILGSLIAAGPAPWAAGVLAALALALAGVAYRRAARTDFPAPAAVGAIGRSGLSFAPALIGLGVVVGVSIAAELTASVWSSLLLREEAPKLAAISGLGAAFFSACQAALRFNADAIRLRMSDLRIIIGSFAIAALGFALVSVQAGFAASVAGFALIGVGTGPIVPCGFALAARQSAAGPAVGLASASLFSALSRLPAPLATGAIAERLSLPIAFAAFALALLTTAAAAAVVAYLTRERRAARKA